MNSYLSKSLKADSASTPLAASAYCHAYKRLTIWCRIDIECPIKKGYMEISKEVNIPRQVPPGKYTVLADVNTKDKRAITCMEATIVFPR